MADCFIGEMRMFGGNFAPEGWAICDGRSLPVSSYETLYTIIGRTYGGDANTFKLPDLRGRIPVGQGTGPGIAAKTLGQMGGSETVVLANAQLPQHTHDIVISNAAGTAASPQNALWAGSSVNLYSTSTAAPNGQMNAEAITAVGGNPPQGHNNMMPFLSVNFIIAVTDGYYPQAE